MARPLLPCAFRGGSLRRLHAGDLRSFQAYRSIPELGRYQGWPVMSDAEAAAFLAEMSVAPLFTPGRWVQLGIGDSAGDLVGDVGIFLSSDGLAGEIGFTLAPHAQGRGIATHAVSAALDLIFRLTRVEKVLGITDRRNVASVRLLERTGFRHVESRETVFRGEPCSESVFARLRGDGGGR